MGKAKGITKLIGYATKAFEKANRQNAGKIVKTYTNKAGEKIEVFQRTQRRWFAPNRTITTKFIEGSDDVLQQTVQQKKGNLITTFTKNADGTSMRSEVNRKNGWKDVAVFDASGKTTKTVYRGKNSSVTTIDTNPASKDDGLITLTRWKNEQKGLRGISVERQSNPLVLEDYYLDGKNIAHKGITTRTNVNEAFSPNMTKDLSWKNEGKDLTKALAEANKGKGGFSWGKALGWGTAATVATGGGLYALAPEEDKAAIREFFGLQASGTEAIVDYGTDGTDGTDALDVTDEDDAPEATEETDAPEASEETDAPEATEEADAPEATEEADAPETTEETDAPEASEEADAPEAAENTSKASFTKVGSDVPSEYTIGEEQTATEDMQLVDNNGNLYEIKSGDKFTCNEDGSITIATATTEGTDALDATDEDDAPKASEEADAPEAANDGGTTTVVETTITEDTPTTTTTTTTTTVVKEKTGTETGGAAPVSTTPTQSQKSIHTVVTGDNLWNIAKDVLQKANPGKTITNGEIFAYWNKIKELKSNDHLKRGEHNFNRIYPGDKVNLPPIAA